MQATKAGLKFSRDMAQTFRSGGLRCFGQLLDDPQFVNRTQFKASIAGLEDVHLGKLFLEAAGRTNPGIEGYRAILGHDNRVISVVSSQYVPVQNKDVALPLYEAAKARKLNTVGRFDEMGRADWTGHVALANPEFTVPLLKEHDDDIMLGVRWWNGYSGDRSFGAELFGVRMVCVNYNLWGKLLGEFRQVHMGSEDVMLAEYEHLLTKALDASPVLSEFVEAGRAVELTEAQAELAIWGISGDVGPLTVEMVTGNLKALAPVDLKRDGLTAWTLYNGVTAYLTYRGRGDQYIASTVNLTRQATRLLDWDMDRLLANGQKRKDAHLERLEMAREAATVKAVA